MKKTLRLPLKLFGDRLLFIVVTWVFSLALSIFLSFIISPQNIGVIYSVLTSIPYISLIYYESYDAGSIESGQGKASLKSAFLRLFIWQVPSLILFFLYLISLSGALDSSITGFIFGGIYLAPFIGPRGISLNPALNILQFVLFILLESLTFVISYYLGMKNIVFLKGKQKSSGGILKK